MAQNLPSGAILRNNVESTSADGAEAEDPEKTTVAESPRPPPPPPPIPIIGGVIVPVGKVELLAPWLGLAALASLAALTVAMARKRRA